MRAKQLIEQLIDGGRLPADIVRDMCYGSLPARIVSDEELSLLTEETGGDVTIPYNPDSPYDRELDGTDNNDDCELAFSLETPEDKSDFRFLVDALNGAQIEFDVNKDEDTKETVISYDPEDNDVVDSILHGLGIDFDEVDDSPEANAEYRNLDGTTSDAETTDHSTVARE